MRNFGKNCGWACRSPFGAHIPTDRQTETGFKYIDDRKNQPQEIHVQESPQKKTHELNNKTIFSTEIIKFIQKILTRIIMLNFVSLKCLNNI